MPVQTVYFATNRQPRLVGGEITSFTDDIGPVGGANLRFGTIDIDVRDAFEDEAKIVPGSLRVAPENLVPTRGAKKFGSTAVFDEIRQIMRTDPTQEPRSTVIAFIHGFNNGWEDAVTRAGVIAELYRDLGDGNQPLVFVFTWPSTGASIAGVPIPFAAYEHDRRSVASSGLAGARALGILRNYVRHIMEAARARKTGFVRDDLCDARFHLIVHSMGHQVLSQVMAALPVVVPEGVGRVFDEVILAAADESATALDDRIAGDPATTGSLFPLTALAKRITVYSNREDWILHTLSEDTKRNDRRLGVDGPATLPYAANVTSVDCTDVVDFSKDMQEHQYYRRIPRVRDDILRVLRGQPHDAIADRVVVSSQRYRLK